MTTYTSDDEDEKLKKKTDPLPGRKIIPPAEETPQAPEESTIDPLQELRQNLYSEELPQDPSKNDIFKRMTGTLSNRKSTQQPKDTNGPDRVFGVRTAGNVPFEPTDRQEPETDWTRNTVILQNAPKSEPFIEGWPKTRQPESNEMTSDDADTKVTLDSSSPQVSKVRPMDPNDQEAVWDNYHSNQTQEEKPAISMLEEKAAQTPRDRKRLPSGFDRQQQVSRFISYNPKRSTLEQFKELSKIERTLIITLSVAVICLIGLIAFLFIQSRLPGFGNGNPAAELTPGPTISPPIPAGLRLPGGWSFVLGSGIMVNGEWNPKTSEWLFGTEVRRVIAIPWNKQLEAVVQTFEPGDLLELKMSNGDAFSYKVLTVSEIAVNDTSVLYDIRPTLAVILMKPEAEQRWVVIAEPQ